MSEKDTKENLEEVKKASGEDSYTAETFETGSSARAADNSGGENAPIKQGSSDIDHKQNMRTKVGMINAMTSKMNRMKKDDLLSAYKSMMEVPARRGDQKDNGDPDKIEQGSSRIADPLYYKVTKEDMDLDFDVADLFKDDDLSEEAQTKIRTIFEAAVVQTVNRQIQTIYEDVSGEISTLSEEAKDEISESLDAYLDKVVGDWLEENRLTVESGLRAELAEDFLTGLHKLFAECYVDVPEDKVDVVEELVDENSRLETELSDLLEEHSALKKELSESQKAYVFNEITENMTDLDREKFRDLASTVTYVDEETYSQALEVLKETFLDEDTDDSTGQDFDGVVDTPEDITEEVDVAGPMSAYVRAIGSGNAKRAATGSHN